MLFCGNRAGKGKKRLWLHVYEKNTGAAAFYQAEGFHIENSVTEKETGEQEYLMVSEYQISDFDIKILTLNAEHDIFLVILGMGDVILQKS